MFFRFVFAFSSLSFFVSFLFLLESLPRLLAQLFFGSFLRVLLGAFRFCFLSFFLALFAVLGFWFSSLPSFSFFLSLPFSPCFLFLLLPFRRLFFFLFFVLGEFGSGLGRIGVGYSRGGRFGLFGCFLFSGVFWRLMAFLVRFSYEKDVFPFFFFSFL